MRQKNLVSRRVPALPILVAGIAAFIPLLHANPKGAQVTNGAITISGGAGVTTINQTTQRGIIHWQDFSIGAGEMTRFVQPNAGAATLNRVTGGIPSTIHGTLQANGQVYLVNPNGVLVGPNGRINTAAFTASTLDVPDASFMSGGDMRFSGDSLKGVVNLGSITATDGDVMLLGRSVQNDGSISAPNGVAGLAAGGDILLKAAGDERVVIKSGTGGGTGVKNSGSIKAAQAELKAAGGNVYALAIKNTGVVQATGITKRNGRIFLGTDGGSVENSGRLIARNADGSGGSVKMKGGKGGAVINKGGIDVSASHPKKNGGTVEITGDTLTLGSGSVITASGLNAGTIAIGVSADVANQTTASGGIATLALGANSDAAQRVTIEAGSRIEANSTGAGSGGRVVVWSEKQSVVGGVIEAKGGDLGGNGGLVETSGRIGLTIIPGTKVNTNAPKGKSGTWLLDPAGITIDNTASDTANGSSSPFDQNAATNHVRASDIVAALGLGNVTVTTTGFPAGEDIIVNAPILIPVALPGTPTLILDSAGGIAINSSIGGALSNVIFQIQSHGDITVASGATVQMNGISVFAITGNISIADRITALNNKNIFLNAPTGSIAFTGSGQASASSSATVFLDTHSTSSGTITGPSGSNAVIAGKLDITSGRQGIGTSASPLTTSVSNLEASVASNSQTTGGGIFIKNSGTTLHIGGVDPTLNGVQVSNLPGFGGIEITNIGGDLLLDSATAERVTAPGNIKLTTGSSNDIQVLNASANSVRSANGSVTLNAGGNVFIGDAATLGVNVRGQFSVTVQAGGNVSVSGSLLKAGGGTGLTVNAGGDINILTSGGFAATIGTSGGTDVNLTSGTGKTFNNSTLANGGVKTTLADDVTGVFSTGADVSIMADQVAINSPINAGAGSRVSFTPVTLNRAFDIGTKNSSKLSFNVAELNQVSAPTVNIGTFFGAGPLKVSANLAALPFQNLLLATTGTVSISNNIDVGTGTLTIFGGAASGLTGAGNLTAAALSLSAPAGPIKLSGIINSASLTFTSGGATTLDNAGNGISSIAASSAGNGILLGISINNGSNDLHIAGAVTTSGFAFLTTRGDLYFDAGGSLSAHGIQLDISSGHFVNHSGPGALSVSAGSRFVVYEKDQLTPHNIGELDQAPSFASQDTTDSVHITDANADPLGGGNVFYFGNLPPASPPPIPSNPSPAANSAQSLAQKLSQDNTYLFLKGQAANAKKYGLASVDENEPDDLSEREQVYLRQTGLFPLKNVSLESQWAIYDECNIETTPTKRDIELIIRAAAGRLTAEQIRVLTPENIYYLAELGYKDMIAVGSLKDPDGSIGLRLSSLAKGGKVMGSDRADRFVDAGPTGVRYLADAGYRLSGLFETSQLPLHRNLFSTKEASKKGYVVAMPASSMPLDGSVLLLAPTLAPGGTALVATGGGNLVATGGGNLVATGGGNLVATGGGNLITNDGGTLITNDGGTLITNDGGTLITNDGGTLVSDKGLGVISNDSAGLISNKGGGFANPR